MRTLLRRIPGGQYVQAPDEWTSDPDKACDFKTMERAIDFVEKAGYRNMEVTFVFNGPNRRSAVRVDTLEGLEQ